MTGPTNHLRREDDRRLQNLELKVDEIKADGQETKTEVKDTRQEVREIRDWLIGEPESSALGRQLLSRAKANRADIEKHDVRLDAIEAWRTEWKGTWRFITAVATILALVATFFAILSYFGVRPV